ncbi:MAG: hypothetical protein HC794_04655 [Nitrospiraceae bacterium]|nr:hypothetical protein [Nitrospiraceae bacterium]
MRPGELVGRTFPVGIDPSHEPAIAALLSTARAAGRADEILVDSTVKDRRFVVSASLFRHESVVNFLVRMGVHSTTELDRGLGVARSGQEAGPCRARRT